jgi:hypothetical protein
VSDPVEMLMILHQPPKSTPSIAYKPSPRSSEQLYAELNPKQIARMMDFAAKKLGDADVSVADDVARCLAAFTSTRLDQLLDDFVERAHFWPPIAFRKADSRFARALIDALPDSHQAANQVLQCLAWIGSDEVVAFLTEADRHPPAWAKPLYVSPGKYAHVAGWELRDGHRHELHFDDCYAVHPAGDGASVAPCVRAMVRGTGTCQWCGRHLCKMVQLDVADSRLHFLPRIGTGLSVPTCDVCTCFTDGGPFFFAMADGGWEWAPQNQKPEYLPSADEEWDSSPWAEVPVSIRARSAIHAADEFLPTTFSQIGGLPTWIQDSQYPACCRCGCTMTFLAQLDNGVFPLHEGMYYAFICHDCGVTATCYQQT